jgi:hypothetical protein
MSMKRKSTKTSEWLGPMTESVSKYLPDVPDVLVRDAGTLFLFCPLTPRAKAWIAEYVQPDAQWFGNALVVEHRYALPLAEGMIDEGLVLA